MTRPQVVVHTMASADARTDRFAGDVALYYELVGAIDHDAVLAGSRTMTTAAADQGIDLTAQDPAPAGTTGPTRHGTDTRPLLVVVDGSGRLTRFAWLRDMPYWRDVLVLCSEATPAEHLRLLERHDVRHLVTGTDRVDLPRALQALGQDHGVRRIRVDSGGVLSGTLLRAGLLDEVSVLLCPYLVGGRSARGLFVADDLPEQIPVTDLELLDARRVGPHQDVVHLRYRVR